MNSTEFALKLSRWLAFAKTQRIRKYDAWPIWFQFMRMVGVEVKPPLFWSIRPLYCYYVTVFFLTFAGLTQYFTRHFIWGNGVWHWDNLLITLIMAQPIALLLAFNIRIKQKRLNLPDWESF